jgi:hypothetical protein
MREGGKRTGELSSCSMWRRDSSGRHTEQKGWAASREAGEVEVSAEEAAALPNSARGTL